MAEDRMQPKDLQDLSRAISRAIMNSEEVRETLFRLNRQRLIGSESFLALVLRMVDLVELVEGRADRANNASARRTTTRRRRKSIDARIVDGRRLSTNELAFLKFCQENFDEEEWLRSLRIRLE